MAITIDPHAVGEALTYTVDFSNRVATGDTIASADWTVEAGMTEGNKSIDTTNHLCTCRISGSTTGVYTITCVATTTAGDIMEETFLIRVRDLPVYPS